MALSQRPAALSQRPVALSQRPVALSQRPAASSQRPVALSQHPAASSQRPVALSQRPAVPTIVIRGRNVMAACGGPWCEQGTPEELPGISAASGRPASVSTSGGSL